MSKKQKLIPEWAIRAVEDLDTAFWDYETDEKITIYNAIPTFGKERVARIIADAYDASAEERVVKLEAAIKSYVNSFDKIMRGPISYGRGHDLAQAIGTLEFNIK